MGAGELAAHLKDCRKVDAVVAGDGDLTSAVDALLAAGWTYDGTEYVEGKRIRYLISPPGYKIENDDGLCPHGVPPEFCGNCHEEEGTP